MTGVAVNGGLGELLQLSAEELIISYYNYLIRVISGLGIEVEPEYRALLEPYQPPHGKAWR